MKQIQRQETKLKAQEDEVLHLRAQLEDADTEVIMYYMFIVRLLSDLFLSFLAEAKGSDLKAGEILHMQLFSCMAN